MSDILRNLEKARQKTKEMRERGESIRVLNPIEKAKEDPLSRAKAITAKCYDCVGQDSDPNWKGAVKHCPCTDCPLYTVRPYK